MLLLSVIVGVCSGLVAVLLKEAVFWVERVIRASIELKLYGYAFVLYPLLGILTTMLIAKYVFKEKVGHGISNLLFTISKKNAILKRTQMFSRMLTSSITVGFGGSVGLEAPAMVTGSAIASNLAQLMHLTYKKRTMLIGCAVAGAIAGIFNSPVAGVIFAIEVILVDVTIAAFIPLLLASVAGSVTSLALLGDDVMFSFKLTESFSASDVPYYLALGLFSGLMSVYFTRSSLTVEDWMNKIPKDIPRALIGGLVLGLMIFLFPAIYGEGYNSIKTLLNGEGVQLLEGTFFEKIGYSNVVLLIFVAFIGFLKPLAASLTIASGGAGGIFAPSVFVGGVSGFFFASILNSLIPGVAISTANFTLVGMCGVLSGVLHAPLTAIFLIAEITDGYTLFVPLMIVSAMSYTVTVYFEKYSLYTKKLVEKGDWVPNEKDRRVLSLIHLRKIIEKDLKTIHPEASLGDLIQLVQQSKRNIFPVVNEANQLVGIVTLDDVREIMFDSKKQQEVLIQTIMHAPPAEVSTQDSMELVMNKFERTGAWNLPVIDNGAYVGFLSKSRIFNTYRKKLIYQNRQG